MEKANRTSGCWPTTKNIYRAVIHLKDPRYKRYFENAEKQFKTLGLNKGASGQSAYMPVDNVSNQSLMGSFNTFISVHAPEAVSAARQGRVDDQNIGAYLLGRDPTGGRLASMFQAAMVEWVGAHTGARISPDVLAWALDRDLFDPSLRSMEVRLLINKRQLDELKRVLDEIINAGRRGQAESEEFFTALQAVTAVVSRTPDQIKMARSMSQTGLVPEFIEGLPYKSRIMGLTNELWAAWGYDAQGAFLEEMESKSRTYQSIHDSPELWIEVNKGDDPDSHVFPISLALLP